MGGGNGEKARKPDLGTVRTHLANERTFLAWCRTALAVAAFGFLLEKLDLFLRAGHETVNAKVLERVGWLGQTAFWAAGVLLLLAGWRFISTWRAIGQDDARFSPLPDIMVLVAAVILMAVALLLTWGLTH